MSDTIVVGESHSLEGAQRKLPLFYCLVWLAYGCGLIAIAIGDTLGRESSALARPVFWLGVFIVWVPAVAYLATRRGSRQERMSLLLGLGLSLYLVDILYSPRFFTAYDAMLHAGTAENILRTGRVFTLNPLLPISALYPGLEVVTTGVVQLTGLTLFPAGLIVIGTARIILILSLYLLFERISKSGWLASLATLIYATNPNFVFFDSDFAYESLALPLAFFVLFLVARGQQLAVRERIGITVVITLGIAAVAVTHHVTSFILTGELITLAIIALIMRRVRGHIWLSGIAIMSLAAVTAWAAFVATSVLRYLRPNLSSGLAQVLALIGGDASPKGLFKSTNGQITPFFDRYISLATSAIVALSLPFGWWALWKSRRFGLFEIFLAIAALAFPISGLFRLTAGGAQLSNRANEFIYLAVGFIAALAVITYLLNKQRWLRVAVTVILTAVLLYGGVIIGQSYWSTIPGPYLVSADQRSVEREGVSDAVWTRNYLGIQQRFLADRINGLLLLAYGQQRVVSAAADGVPIYLAGLSPTLTPYDITMLHQARVHYILTDYRDTTALPVVGVYFDDAEPNANNYTRPLPRSALEKFNRLPRASRIFDSGDIVIYDIGPGADDA